MKRDTANIGIACGVRKKHRMHKILPSAILAAVLLMAAPAFAFPPPNMTRDESAIGIRNNSDAGAWITLYKFVSIARIKKIMYSYCIEAGQTVNRVLPLELDQVRAEVKPGCKGDLRLDQTHGIELVGIAARGMKPTHFKEFIGVVEGRHGGKYSFIEKR